jgi:hypothetical protein
LHAYIYCSRGIGEVETINFSPTKISNKINEKTNHNLSAKSSKQHIHHYTTRRNYPENFKWNVVAASSSLKFYFLPENLEQRDLRYRGIIYFISVEYSQTWSMHLRIHISTPH